MPEPAAQPNWYLVEEIFHAALELPAGEREAFISAGCNGDAALEGVVREIVDGYVAQERHNGQPVTEAGARFGAFEVVRKIGEGGMGAVYLGRRHLDFEQQAAIKVIRGSPAAAALMSQRFRQERQILAALDHPNIARLLDGGVTPAGQPYLVMEYVTGVRLDKYCSAANLVLRQRLELFRKICAAVHFAHQHLVIHRDLKPANILVNEGGEPKLLDFGIAKVLAEPGDDSSTTETMTGDFAFTPLYASPEQLRGASASVSGDVYSMGVIFYELLAGCWPYAATGSTPAALVAAVITQEARLLSSVAPESERKLLRGDLDGIAMKALAKLPEDRYSSVEQFSEDVRRYLEGLPVTAVEGTRLYVARKFVRRHVAGVAAFLLVMIALIGGLAATLWQARIAERERVLAEQGFSDARKLAVYLLFPLYDRVRGLQGSLPVRADMAAQSMQYLDRLASGKSHDRDLQLELAEGYMRLGSVFGTPLGSEDSLGSTDKALDSERKAVALLEPLSGSGDGRADLDLAQANVLLGTALNYAGRYDDGIARLKAAAGIFERLTAASPADAARQVEAGRAYLALGDAASGHGGGFVDMATAQQVIPDADQALAHFGAALKISPGESRAVIGQAQAYNLKGNLVAQTNPATALETYRKGLAAIESLPPSARATVESQIIEARLETVIGNSLGQIREYEQAMVEFKAAQAILDRLALSDPKNATNAQRRANLFYSRATAEVNWGHEADAIGDYKQAVTLLDGLIAADPSKQGNLVVRADAQGWVGNLLAKSGRKAESLPYIKASLGYFEQIADRPDAAPQNLNVAASALENQPDPAPADVRRALGYVQRADKLTQGKNHGVLFSMGQAYELLGDGEHAKESYERGLALLPQPAPGQPPSRNRLLFEKHIKVAEGLIKSARPAN